MGAQPNSKTNKFSYKLATKLPSLSPRLPLVCAAGPINCRQRCVFVGECGRVKEVGKGDRLYSVLTSEFLERLVLRCVWRHDSVVRVLWITADQILPGGRVMQVAEAADGHQARDGG